MAAIRISTIIAFQDIFDTVVLTWVNITSKEVLSCGKKWRIKTKQTLPVLATDDNEVRVLKTEINAMPTVEDPLSEQEKAALSALLYQYSSLWNDCMDSIVAFPFETGVALLQEWADLEVPLLMPQPAGCYLRRLFDALHVDPVVSEMCSRCMHGHPDKKYADIFEFNMAMHDLQAPLLGSSVPFVHGFPAGWTNDSANKFRYVAQKNIRYKKY